MRYRATRPDDGEAARPHHDTGARSPRAASPTDTAPNDPSRGLSGPMGRVTNRGSGSIAPARGGPGGGGGVGTIVGMTKS